MIKNCLYCGKEFPFYRGRKRFCCSACQVKHYYENGYKTTKQKTYCKEHGKQSNKFLMCPYCGKVLTKEIEVTKGHEICTEIEDDLVTFINIGE